MTEKLGKVLGVFSAPKDYKNSVRPKVKTLELIEGHGIKNDKFAGKNLDRTVMIVGKIAYDIAKQHGVELEEGSLGENILLDFDPHILPIGTKLTIGDAQIQITENCTICSHLSVHFKELPYLIKDHRGVYCSIIKKGNISINDNIDKSSA